MQSTSLPRAITGPSPLVHFANHAVGILDTPFSIVKLFIDNTNFLKQPDKSHIEMKTLTDFYKYSKKVISNIK